MQFVDIIVANDDSIDRLRELAGTCGIEHSDWICEWQDGGKVAFKFKNDLEMMKFRAKRNLSERFNPEWSRKRAD
jgi:hypothetical protein